LIGIGRGHTNIRFVAICRQLLLELEEWREFLVDWVDVDAQDSSKKPTPGALGCITFMSIE
jgi:hypothetical protein